MLWTPGRHRRSTPDSARFRPVDDLGVDTPLHPQAWGRPELRPQLSPGARCRVHTVSTGFSTGRGRSAHRVVPKMWTLLTACRRGVRGPRVYRRGHGPERPPERSSTGSRTRSRTGSRTRSRTGSRTRSRLGAPHGQQEPPRALGPPVGALRRARGSPEAPAGLPRRPGGPRWGSSGSGGRSGGGRPGGRDRAPARCAGALWGCGRLEGRWRAGDARSAPPAIRRRPAS